MTKRILAVIVALMIASLCTVAFATAVEPEFAAPTGDVYTRYTVVEYTIEDIGADLVCTVSANDDNTQFNILCNFYGDDQDWTGTWDGTATTKIADKTGFMDGDAAAIITAALAREDWVAIGDARTEDAALELPCEPEFAPVSGGEYTVYTVVEYTIEDIGADLVCTVSANDEMTSFDILCNFYGDDQDWTGTWDGTATTKIADKTGFMDGDAAAIITAAIEQNIWVPIA